MELLSVICWDANGLEPDLHLTGLTEDEANKKIIELDEKFPKSDWYIYLDWEAMGSPVAKREFEKVIRSLLYLDEQRRTRQECLDKANSFFTEIVEKTVECEVDKGVTFFYVLKSPDGSFHKYIVFGNDRGEMFDFTYLGKVIPKQVMTTIYEEE